MSLGFVPFFRLLDDYDNHISGRIRSATQTFSPSFDLRELKDSYRLDGEIPGVNQQDIDV